MSNPSRRRVLTTAGTCAIGLVAGCLDSVVDETGVDTQEIPENPDVGTIPDGVVQFRRSLENWGYVPEETIPDTVEEAWRVPEINTGDHSAAKASAVPRPDGGIVLPGDTGYVTALSADGEVDWRAETDMDGRGVHGTPVVADGRVYIGAYDGIFYAFDEESGEEHWSTKLGGSIGSSPKYDGERLFMAVEYPDPDGSTFAVDPDDGEVLWEDDRSRPSDHPHSTPAIDPETGTMVLGSNDGSLYAWEYPDLEFAWEFETDPDNDTNGEIKGPIATYDGAAFFGSWDQRIYRVDLSDGTEDWLVETGGLSMMGPAIDPYDHVVYAGSHDGNLYALDADTGDEYWRFGTARALTGCPTVCADRIVFGSKDQTLYALEKESGNEVWRVDSHGVATSTPLVHDGAIYYAERAPDPENGETDGGGYKLVSAE